MEDCEQNNNIINKWISYAVLNVFSMSAWLTWDIHCTQLSESFVTVTK